MTLFLEEIDHDNQDMPHFPYQLVHVWLTIMLACHTFLPKLLSVLSVYICTCVICKKKT